MLDRDDLFLFGRELIRSGYEDLDYRVRVEIVQSGPRPVLKQSQGRFRADGARYRQGDLEKNFTLCGHLVTNVVTLWGAVGLLSGFKEM